MTGSDRLARCFDDLAKKNRAGLVCFLMAGDPDRDISQHILDSLPDAGADIIELGMPFSDPAADGPSIQKAGQHVLKNGITLEDVLDISASFRKKNTKTPLLLMGYYNPIYSYGVEKFLKKSQNSGVDGLIIVDLPIEEEAELSQPASLYNLDIIRLVSPVTPEDRIKKIAKNARGFLYYVSVLGITGTKQAKIKELDDAIERCRKTTDLPIAIGFGIRTAEQAGLFAEKADAVVVGSAIVERIATLREKNSSTKIDSVTGFVKELKQAIINAKRS